MKPLTPLQEGMLYDLYEHGDLDELARDIGLSLVELAKHAKRLKLRRTARGGKHWSPKQDELLRKEYTNGNVLQLAEDLGRLPNAIKQRARMLGLRRPRRQHVWTKAEIKYLRQHYPDANGREIADKLGITMCVMYRMAHSLGLQKSPDFLSKLAITKGLPEAGAAHGFKKGHVPANKGMKMRPDVYAIAKRTMFKKGQKPVNQMSIGDTRVNADGYLDRKVAETGYGPNDWKAVHRLLWIEHHGPIPEGHIVCFKPGRKTTVEKDITIDALECITKRERMARNTIHNLPPELKSTAYALGRLKKAINRHGREQHGGTPDTPVRHDQGTENRQDRSERRAGDQ